MAAATQMPLEASRSESPAEDSSNPLPDAARAADAWLLTILGAEPLSVRQLQESAQAAGHAWRTVERAKQRLGIKAARSGKSWCWSLPQGRHQEEQRQIEQTSTALVTDKLLVPRIC